MNFQRFPNNPENQPRNFGTDIHEFMNGLSRIAQIMYTSIPIIEFVRIAGKYSLKFCEYLGSSTLSALGVLRKNQSPEAVLEAIWNKQSAWKSFTKISSMVALCIVVMSLLMSKPEMDKEWENTPDQDAEQTQNRGVLDVKSVEDRPYYGEMNEDYAEYPEYPIY